jgi:hypothetical protein
MASPIFEFLSKSLMQSSKIFLSFALITLLLSGSHAINGIYDILPSWAKGAFA